jgi:hypothetical protein
LERIRLVLPESKFSLTGWRHYYGLSWYNGLNIKFSNNWRPIFNWPLIENLIICQTNGFI